jgi:hypothetical protein
MEDHLGVQIYDSDSYEKEQFPYDSIQAGVNLGIEFYLAWQAGPLLMEPWDEQSALEALRWAVDFIGANDPTASRQSCGASGSGKGSLPFLLATLKSRAADLARAIGTNRFFFQRADGTRIAVDLDGKPHFDKSTGTTIDTPHVHEYERHANPNDPTRVKYKKRLTRPATESDLRIVRRLARGRP